MKSSSARRNAAVRAVLARYDATPDGQRFLMIRSEQEPRLQVVLDWAEELKKKVPSAAR